ncbi:MAG: hypothetical protein MZV70_65625 [Desulfobacterales bacterium]|nr:hypothetical protein [Desulfobacterales bacterium]
MFKAKVKSNLDGVAMEALTSVFVAADAFNRAKDLSPDAVRDALATHRASDRHPAGQRGEVRRERPEHLDRLHHEPGDRRRLQGRVARGMGHRQNGVADAAIGDDLTDRDAPPPAPVSGSVSFDNRLPMSTEVPRGHHHLSSTDRQRPADRLRLFPDRRGPDPDLGRHGHPQLRPRRFPDAGHVQQLPDVRQPRPRPARCRCRWWWRYCPSSVCSPSGWSSGRCWAIPASSPCWSPSG